MSGSKAAILGYVATMAAALLAACASHGTAFTPSASELARGPAARSLPALPPHDRGRRKAAAPVDGAIVLNLNKRSELEHLVASISDPRSPRFRHFLTPAQFDARFAPTPQQYGRLLRVLRRSGFTIVQTYPDRCLVDVRAPNATAERFFRTVVHDFDQGRYGIRYANVRPLHVPRSIAPLVRDVELNSIVYARPADERQQYHDAKRTPSVVKNGGFEKRLAYWRACGKVAISTQHPYAGKYDARLGSASSSAPNVDGFQALCQKVTIPHGGVLVAHTYNLTNLRTIGGGYQEVGLMSRPGKIVKVLRKSVADRAHWITQRWPVEQFEGQALYVFFAVSGRGQTDRYDTMYVDDVALTGLPTPTPSPSASPSSSPSTSPTPVGPGPGSPLTGPTFGPRGWYPRGIADAFDFPVQHGYDGRGTTAAILTQSAVRTGDLQTFLSANAITRTGTLTETPIGSGPISGSDPTEATIDVETIAALAPHANLIAYEMPKFTNTYIIDAYQKAIGDAKASVVDASFGECDTDDTNFDDAVEQQAISAAAIGMTFVAASGDEGAACYSLKQTTNINKTQVPASNPHVFAVGGNESDTSVSAANPVVWNGNNGLFSGASGGGVSTVWPLPSYQTGVGGEASTTQRNVPDVSFPAVDDDLYLYGTDQTVGGTSWAGSIATAMLLEGVEICGNLGYVDPAVYGVFSNNGEGTMFVDVTSGDNHYAGFPTFYTATAGYDNASGIGLPNGLKFVAALCGKSARLVR
ncbi:MAG TPA: S53 family serine peptidase [Candidatus Baltobacteraceae bacterium]|nr:S53 family serine peptidase [Candidatus Baltobacteraceae bacterium]